MNESNTLQNNSNHNSKCGVVIGTRILNNDGRKPVEMLNVGDQVLTNSIHVQGELGYKQILQTCIIESQIIYELLCTSLNWNYTFGKNSDPIYSVFATGNLQFFAKDKGWMQLSNLSEGDILHNFDSSFVKVASVKPVYCTNQHGIGWIPESLPTENYQGHFFDLINNRPALIKNGTYELNNEPIISNNEYFKIPTYSIEVQDFHTYFLGGAGILVSDHVR